MSVHDRRAALETPRYSLTVSRYSHGCAQYETFENLREHEVEAEKRWQIESHPGYTISFDVERL